MFNTRRKTIFNGLFAIALMALSAPAIHSQTVAYVANSGSNTVSVIDTASNVVTTTIPVGHFPDGVVFSPDGTLAYVTNQVDGTVSIVDTKTTSVVGTISVQTTNPVTDFPAITPDGAYLYVPDETGGLKVVSTSTNSVITTIPIPTPDAVVITPDGSRAYVQTIFTAATGAFVIDTATNSVIATPTVVPSRVSFGIAQAQGSVYLTGGVFPSVSVIDTGSNTVTAVIPYPGNPEGIAITPDGKHAYVAGELQRRVNVIDIDTNTVEPVGITVGNAPVVTAVTPDGSAVYVTNLIDGTVSVIATSTNTVISTIKVGVHPLVVAVANLNAPFANLNVENLVITPGGYHEQGEFTLGANSQGIDLNHQPVTLTLGDSSLTVTAGSFRQVGGSGHFVFEGTVNGLPVEINLQADKSNGTQFTYVINVQGIDLTGEPNPIAAGLKIGNNTGTASASF